jgi:hypothetical protein
VKLKRTLFSLQCLLAKERSRLSFDEIFSFLTPFSPAVWFSFLALMLATGSWAAETWGLPDAASAVRNLGSQV